MLASFQIKMSLISHISATTIPCFFTGLQSAGLLLPMISCLVVAFLPATYGHSVPFPGFGEPSIKEASSMTLLECWASFAHFGTSGNARVSQAA